MSITIEEMADFPAETRAFNFPNGGHSIRKLAADLTALGDTKVSLKVIDDQGYGGYKVSFIEDTKWGKARADLLAKKLLTLGTRFTLNMSRGYAELEFHTNFSDIMSNPEAYGIA